MSSEQLSSDGGDKQNAKMQVTAIKHPADPKVSGITVYDHSTAVYEVPKDY